MPITRPELRKLGITEKEALDFIMDEHNLAVDAAKETVKETISAAKQKIIDGLQAKIDAMPDSSGNEKLQADYEKLKGEFDTYKTDVTNKEITKAQDKALHELFINEKANDKYIPLVVKGIDRSKIQFDGDIEKGFTVKNGDDIVKPVKEQYGDIFGTVKTVGAGVATPPKGDGGGMQKTTGNDMNDFILKLAGKI